MITVQETTVWGGNAVNHKYILSDDRMTMYGYIKNGDRLPTLFKKPIGFGAQGRSFTVLVRTKDVDPDTQVWNVKGSKGNIYNVTRRDGVYRCTCPASTFRGHCKHIDQINEKD